MLKTAAPTTNSLKIISQNIETGSRLYIKSSDALDPFFVRKIPVWKRSMDILGSILGLILFAPVFLLIASIIKIVSPGPVFFKQERVGYGGKPFTMWKFRTMKVNADISNHQRHIGALLITDQPMKKLDNDLEIIPFGRILRNSCIDEFPQLINVLRGEMSLVGPRPDVLYAIKGYETWHYARFNTAPGLTGLWQVSGKNKITYRDMMRLDIAYDKHRSFWLDLKILLLTLPAIMTEIRDSFLRKDLGNNELESPDEIDAIKTL